METIAQHEVRHKTVKKRKSFKSPWRKVLKTGILTWLGLLGVWSIAAYFSDPQFLPSPLATLQGAIELSKDGSLFIYMGYSFVRVLAGWFLGNLIAIPLGLLIGSNRTIRSLVEPLINFVRFIPPLAFITLFMLWFGIGEQSKVFLIVYATFFVVTINTLTGVLSISEDKIRSAKSMGASNFQVLRYVIIPASIPYIFTGAKLAMGSSFMAIVGAEMVAANEGVGFMIWNARLYFQTDWIFVGLVVLGLMGFLMDRLFVWIGKKFLKRYNVVS
ncbi:ABC transporter permease [Metabacillus fastidiosus]|uniref:ABC transporter permease n=1 Tax=Metabacillus fastidiosus TaxID=1458 RepID=UPI002DBB9439|nr:ABC transporter permease [Metabacillus fastidiosus]MEC2074798.1 ABC transporter permease [Metabacillus fastidiosus]